MNPKLWILSDVENHPFDSGILRAVCSFAKPRSVVLVLRDRKLDAAVRLRLGEELAKIVESTTQLLGVAGSTDLARLLPTSILHLGHRDLGIRDAKRLVPSLALSVALHEGDEIPDEIASANHVVVSPYAARRKNREAIGRDGYRRIGDRVRAHGFQGDFVLLGGIDRKIVKEALPGQSVGVAVMGAARSEDELLGIVEALGQTRG